MPLLAPTFSPSENTQLAVVRLARCPQVGPKLFARLLARFGSAEDALYALPDLAREARRAVPKLPDPAIIEKEISATHAFGARMISVQDDAYPQWLKMIPDAPPVLTYRGDITLLERPCVGLVGARNASALAVKFAGILAHDIGKMGYATVSGLARGIDTSVHQSSVMTGTVGVIAGGIDHVYPKENAKLYATLAAQGLILTEAAFGSAPRAEHFPRRNRIISGVSLGVVVVEAAARSGSLITARLAGEQGREVMAVPGFPMDPRAEGTNKLLKQGATLIESAEDIREALAGMTAPRMPAGFGEEASLLDLFVEETSAEETVMTAHEIVSENLTGSEKILARLHSTSISVDALCDALGMLPAQVLPTLLELEMDGKIQRAPGGGIFRI